MTESARDFMSRKSREWEAERDRVLRFKDIGRQGTHRWIRKAWTFHPQSTYAEKVFVVERLENADSTGRVYSSVESRQGRIEYRFGYFIVGRIGRVAGRWVWANSRR
jgi:hypothetical protein